MKFLIIIIISFNCLAESVLKTSLSLYKKKEYFHALDVIANEYKYNEPSDNIKKYIEKLVKKTGTHYFNTFEDIELRKLNTPSTQLVMAKRNLYLNKFTHALKRINEIPKDHRFYPESLLVKGTVYFQTKNFKQAFKTYSLCVDRSLERENQFSSKIKRYYAVIKETCMINIARIFFNEGKFKKAIKYYEKVPKNSFKWPYIIIQKAWAYHHLKDYNRSLGLLMTYESPLLDSYFDPEAEYLKALNYYELCQYQDALEIVKKYYKKYKPRAKQIKNEIAKAKGSRLYFHRFMKTPISKFSKTDNFLRNLKTQISKRVKYNLDTYTISRIKKEYKLTTDKKTKKVLRNVNNDLLEQINHYVKVSFYRLINNIHLQSEHLFSIRLEILSKVRRQLYRGLVNSNRQRGDIKNINKSAEEEYWNFDQEFWADELGEYSFALPSRCKLKKVKKDEKAN